MDNIRHEKGKIYYTMGEVAEMFDVRPSLIRFWEKKFDILKPRKNKKGNRLFTPEDVDNLRMIYHLVKEKGMTLDGAGRKMKGAGSEGLSRDMEILDRLQAIKAMLAEVKQAINLGSGLRDEEWEEETPGAETGADIQPAPESGAAPQPGDNDEAEWIDETPADTEVPAAEVPAAEAPAAGNTGDEDDEYGFGRGDSTPGPFDYEPAADYDVPQTADAGEGSPQPAEPGSSPAAENTGSDTEREETAPKPRRKRASRTIRLDDEEEPSQQPAKPRIIEQTLF